MYVEFEWDLSKELENRKKHGLGFTEAVETFSDPYGVQLVDESHSKSEERYYWVGKSNAGRVLTTRFTKRGAKIRVIGCAEWRKFRRFYEAAKNK